MDYYNKIKSQFMSNEIYKNVKDYYKNRNDLTKNHKNSSIFYK